MPPPTQDWSSHAEAGEAAQIRQDEGDTRFQGLRSNEKHIFQSHFRSSKTSLLIRNGPGRTVTTAPRASPRRPCWVQVDLFARSPGGKRWISRGKGPFGPVPVQLSAQKWQDQASNNYHDLRMSMIMVDLLLMNHLGPCTLFCRQALELEVLPAMPIQAATLLITSTQVLTHL